MRERAQSLGGVFTLHTAPGRGAHVSVRLPLDEDPMSERLEAWADGNASL